MPRDITKELSSTIAPGRDSNGNCDKREMKSIFRCSLCRIMRHINVNIFFIECRAAEVLLRIFSSGGVLLQRFLARFERTDKRF